MPGPAPTKDPRRRNATPSAVQLPAEGRKGDAPTWPLNGKVSKAELATWESLWSTPQAVAWERQGPGTVRTIARYTRMLVAAERPGAKSTLAGEVRQLEDRLGLTPMSMLRLRWEIVADEVDARREGPKVTRLKAVDPSALAGS